ncbi:retrotransposon gag protein [Nitzschia inconspicua]|uniref:Retrotransposon gag protein n=1 Tax=Nitzschia inconspicua TaxID=303405 RepID=A0A9K3Q0I7_9STRA|nr:retrotransposon gag protein [Nitzschia inconspicua]
MTEEAGDGGSGTTGSAPSTKMTRGDEDRRDQERDRDADDSSTTPRNNINHGSSAKPVAFQGRKDLGEHVYVLGGKKDLFSKTTTTIGEYIAATFEDAGEFRLAFDPENLGFEELTEPKDPDDSASNIVMKRWEMELEAYKSAMKTRVSNEKKAFALVLGQCSPAVRTRLKSAKSWADLNQKSDIIGLLKLLQSCLHDSPGKYESDTIVDAHDRFSSFRQNDLSVDDYHTQFKGLVDALEYSEGNIGLSEKRIMRFNDGKGPHETTRQEWTEATARARDDLLAVRFIKRSDPSRYGALIADLQNQYARGNNQYPTTLDDAYTMLTNYANPQQKPRGDRPKKKKHQGLSFLQEGDHNTSPCIAMQVPLP